MNCQSDTCFDEYKPCKRFRDRSSSPPSELTLEAVQAMTRDLQQQTVSLKAERERLKTAQRQLNKLQQDFTLNQASGGSSGVKEKNRNSETISGNIQVFYYFLSFD